MEILGSLHHFVEYETTEATSDYLKHPSMVSGRAPTLLGLMLLMVAAGLQQTVVAAMLTQFLGASKTGLPLYAATVADVPIGDLVEAMVGENSDMAEVVEDAEQVEVTINLQQNEGETYVSVEGRYDEDADAIAPSSTPSVSTSATIVTSNGVLKYGVRGPQVVQLQDQLKALGYFSANSTGYFGSITQAAVLQFQYANYLTVDGVAGPQTLGLLQQVMGTQYVVNGYAPTSANAQYAVVRSTPSRSTVQPLPPQTTVISIDPSPAQVVSYSAVTATPQSNPPVAATNPATSIDGAKVGTELYIGSQGQIVRDLQRLLKQDGKYSGPVTGYFGPLTTEAVKDFQGEHGLPTNGIVGVKTLVKLNEVLNR